MDALNKGKARTAPAHVGLVSAIETDGSNKQVVTGGGADGVVRVWNFATQHLEGEMDTGVRGKKRRRRSSIFDSSRSFRRTPVHSFARVFRHPSDPFISFIRLLFKRRRLTDGVYEYMHVCTCFLFCFVLFCFFF